MLRHAQDGDAAGKLLLELLQPPLAHVAVAGVVGSAFGIVVVRDHHEVEAKGCQQVETVEPMGGLANLIYLVHGKGEPAKDDGRRAGEGGASAAGEVRRDQLGYLSSPPLSKSVGGASRTGEDVARIAKLVVESGERDRIG